MCWWEVFTLLLLSLIQDGNSMCVDPVRSVCSLLTWSLWIWTDTSLINNEVQTFIVIDDYVGFNSLGLSCLDMGRYHLRP